MRVKNWLLVISFLQRGLMMLNTPINKPNTQSIIPVLSCFNITCPNNIKLSTYHGDLTNDSRAISSDANAGDIFCAIIGHTQDGRQYIEQAIANGAKLVLSECENKSDHGSVRFIETAHEPVAVVSFYALNNILFKVASAYYQAPENNMTMIGITGTNGKTTTKELCREVLKEKSKISEDRIEVDASVKFLENKALFIVKISPVEIKTTNEDGTVKDDKSNFEWYKSAIKSYDSYNNVTIHFKDKDGFKLFEKEIRISRDYIRTLNYNGEVGTYRYEGTLNIDADTAKHVTSMYFVWSIK